jgi:hypothetical protein
MNKEAASRIAAAHNKHRKGRRPIRVENLLKKASGSGVDLRTSMAGGTKFPTLDSMAFPVKQLKDSQQVGNIGPGKPIRGGLTMADVIPKYGSNEAIAKDPLILFLKKQGKAMETNDTFLPAGTREPEYASADPMPTARMNRKGEEDWKAYLKMMFAHADQTPPKNTQKYFAPKPGTVDTQI